LTQSTLQTPCKRPEAFLFRFKFSKSMKFTTKSSKTTSTFASKQVSKVT
jgi:hypothetical protein